MSPAERLALGQELSQQAMAMLVASVKAGHAPTRALWSDDHVDLEELEAIHGELPIEPIPGIDD